MSGPTAFTYESVLSTSARIHTVSTDANSKMHVNPMSTTVAIERRRDVELLIARRIEADSRARADLVHTSSPTLSLYRSTGRTAYVDDMGFEVRFEDDTTTQVIDADAYEQEGPLTTFFDRNGGGGLTSAFALRVASFRTNRIVEIRRVPYADATRLAS
jgi:hypothetical protein